MLPLGKNRMMKMVMTPVQQGDIVINISHVLLEKNET
jgi:hypothetical protein